MICSKVGGNVSNSKRYGLIIIIAISWQHYNDYIVVAIATITMAIATMTIECNVATVITMLTMVITVAIST